MRILIRNGSRPTAGPFRVWVPSLVLAFAVWCGAGTAEAQKGEIRCSVTENGAAARGTMVVEQNGREVGGGSCGVALSVPAGKCTVTVRLDGTLDNPSKSVDVEVVPGKAAPVAIDFQTGVLEVRIEATGPGGIGTVTVNRGSQRIGTIGSGVAARLSTGKYEIVVRLSGQERRYAVDLRPGQRRIVRAQF